MRYLTVKDLTFYYDKEPVLEGVSYHIDAGEFVTLTGENGAAKSTLLKASLGLLKPSQGSVERAELNREGQVLRIAYLPQTVSSFNSGFPSTVEEFVASGRYPRKSWWKGLTEHDKEHVQVSLEAVGLWEQRKSFIGALSGGQKQRVALARMFASDPDFFVLDEPTTGMDAVSKEDFYELMHHSAHKHGKAVLMVTHDPEEVAEYADRNIHLLRKQDSPWRCFQLHQGEEEGT
ncbi:MULTISPECIES: metal ABC transporter ATP-binding protein [unclassified Streptococcus]|uniref:metal ABC transporter ATP-binding protein n=1 Tax=unclassified Streptococcus TaxID=2608887 RepID=UPI0010729624|nr:MULTISPECIES: metal ABC transporter ATP-binding protein [unclassified Streptococcus]MBF0805868.1 metal ABC transporter ATP-binding protein [Streptococcus sp. 19428wA2_WM07]TFU28545.1 metal ABC transporter ATP-binding protein [Streptococcus sp. WM07]